MDPKYWSQWSDALRRGHFTSPVLVLLEGGGAFRSIIAQGMLAVIPFVGSLSPSWNAFAEMLEDPDFTMAFAEYLRKEVA